MIMAVGFDREGIMAMICKNYNDFVQGENKK